jgi:hypothetical protein
MTATPQYVRETSEEELRAKARERVARDARNGYPPHQVDSADLAWAFEGHEAELEELEELAAQAEAARVEHHSKAQRRAALQAMTERVLAEQDAERRRAAEVEARTRLGWKKDEQP